MESLISLAKTSSGVFDDENPSEAASFTVHLERLRDLLKREQTADLTLLQIYESVFPSSQGNSRRVQFSNLRSSLRKLVKASKLTFEIVQPALRGVEPDQIVCYFEVMPMIAAMTGAE